MLDINIRLIRNAFCCIALLFFSSGIFAQYKSLQHASIERNYLVHLPKGYTRASKLPLLLALHGGFGNAYSLESQSQLSAKADAENFIVVYPEGVVGGLLNVSSWNAGWCCGYASNSNVDDVGFIDVLLDTLVNEYSIDQHRIYATGMSNGGFMCYRLACELSGRIAAIAPVAASMSMTNCAPQRSVPIISFHSYIDTHVPYDGGIGDGPSKHYNLPQDSVLGAWAQNNMCAVEFDTIVNSNAYAFIQSSTCDCSATIQHYATQDGGHSWPGGKQTTTGDPCSKYIDASDLMWSFFQEHSLICKGTGLDKQEGEEAFFKLFPNPSSGMVRIETEDGNRDYQLSVVDQVGNIILSARNLDVLDLTELVSGVYFVRMESKDQRWTRKLIIQ